MLYTFAVISVLHTSSNLCYGASAADIVQSPFTLTYSYVSMLFSFSFVLISQKPAPNQEPPRAADDFKYELEHFIADKLKDTVSNEKIVLPTAEGKTQCQTMAAWQGA